MDFMIPAGVRLDMFDGDVVFPGELEIPLYRREELIINNQNNNQKVHRTNVPIVDNNNNNINYNNNNQYDNHPINHTSHIVDKSKIRRIKRIVVNRSSFHVFPGFSVSIPLPVVKKYEVIHLYGDDRRWLPSIDEDYSNIILTNVSNKELNLLENTHIGEINNKPIQKCQKYETDLFSETYNEWQRIIFRKKIPKSIQLDVEKDYQKELQEFEEKYPFQSHFQRSKIIKVSKILRRSKSMVYNAQSLKKEIDESNRTKFSKEETILLTDDDMVKQLGEIPDVTELLVGKIDLNKADIGEEGETSKEDISRMRSVIEKHKNVFIESSNAAPPAARGVVCDIDVGDAKPVAQRCRRIPEKFKHKLFILIRNLLTAGLIRPSKSPWASPIVLVTKANGIDIRLCIDYRLVNSLTKLMIYNMPYLDDLLRNFEKYMWFFSLDAASGFWVIPLTQRAIQISAFICFLGHFEWLRMPQGLKNAPQIYQRMMDNALWGYYKINSSTPNDGSFDVFENGECLSGNTETIGQRSFIDDIGFGAETWNDGIKKLEKLLTRLEQCNITLSFGKCEFGKRIVKYLSHKVGRDGIEMKAKNGERIENCPFPSTKKEMQSFLGCLIYYQKFISNFSMLAAILYRLREDDFQRWKEIGKMMTFIVEVWKHSTY